MVIFHNEKGNPIAVNISMIEMVISRTKNECFLLLCNGNFTKVNLSFDKIKVVLPEYFILVKSPFYNGKENSFFDCIINSRLMLLIQWEKDVKEAIKELLIYDESVPKWERWSEDKYSHTDDCTQIVFMSGRSVRCDSGIVELCASVEKTKGKIDGNNKKECNDRKGTL